MPAGAPVIVPLALWQAERAALLARGDVGVWLAPADDPAVLADDVAALPLIAVDFPKFTDGRGYSIARLLRERYGFAGELRAIGDVLRDQLFALAAVRLRRVRAPRGPRRRQTRSRAFDDFAGVYAPTTRDAAAVVPPSRARSARSAAAHRRARSAGSRTSCATLRDDRGASTRRRSSRRASAPRTWS